MINGESFVENYIPLEQSAEKESQVEEMKEGEGE